MSGAAINSLLDLFEHNVEQLKALGAEQQMRSRLERLLPRPKPAPPVLSVEDELDLTVIVTLCKSLERYKLTGEQHGAIQRLKRHALTEIARARRARKPAVPEPGGAKREVAA
jgi:hypothetical protein